MEEASTIRGHDGLIRWAERWLEAWDDAWDEVDELIEAGETVVAAIRVHGRGRLSGLEISQRLFDVFELRDGRVLRISEYLDPDQALEAAGLREWAHPSRIAPSPCAPRIPGEVTRPARSGRLALLAVAGFAQCRPS